MRLHETVVCKLPSFVHYLEAKIALVAILLAVLCGVGSYGLYVQLDTSQTATETLLRANVRARRLTEALSVLQDAETGQRGFLLTGRTDYLEPYDRALQMVDRTFANLQAEYVGSNLGMVTVISITEKAHVRIALLRKTVEVRRQQGFEPALQLVVKENGKRVMDNIRQEMRHLLEAEQTIIDRNLLRTRSIAERNVGLWLGAACVVMPPIAFCLLLAVRDARRGRRQSVHLSHVSSHDALTGLLNRVELLSRLEEALAQRPGAVGVLYLDLNGFKAINDELGHAMGDRVLMEVAYRLRATMRPGDTAARLGGDEFVILVEDCSDRSALDVLAARVEAALESISLPGLQQHRIGGSVGSAFSAEDGTSAASLIAAADTAMYARKMHMRRAKPVQSQQALPLTA
ncbi:diguanylate cyclase domain-containing protein [Methylobacterium gossipiicola]|uniref:Diguanylate cyclase (GGDEF) domain-containing protein n=1 Tax=Methylobacterium gossipiicola TaxID=582675 RepID=A0A1I2S368_9HYPH|nr:diguanylate cyclase [Methylobacterium gossipiicola]SFG47314.1 diguanylate cyclase (GGDEF) domain-containing protein [Methylobacterium gossipiicola]